MYKGNDAFMQLPLACLSTSQAKELISINLVSVPAEFPQERDTIVDCGAQRPMSQQDAVGSHGYEMYPQKFVQLIGCRDPNTGKHEGAHRLHQVSAERQQSANGSCVTANGVSALPASIRI